jgi:hypothetical protein
MLINSWHTLYLIDQEMAKMILLVALDSRPKWPTSESRAETGCKQTIPDDLGDLEVEKTKSYSFVQQGDVRLCESEHCQNPSMFHSPLLTRRR